MKWFLSLGHLALILCVAKCHPDDQFTTKVLATYMSHPYRNALAAIKLVALYLEGTSDVGILVGKSEAFDTIFDRWNGEEVVEPDYRKGRLAFTLDAFNDSTWGGECADRRSATAGVAGGTECI